MTNAKNPTIVDGVLKEIGDRLFYEPVRPIKAKRTTTGVSRKTKARDSNRSAPARFAITLKNTTRRAPEVLVKISGGGKSITQIKAHLDYISRNGDVPLEDENGDAIYGREAVRDLRDEWQYGGYPISGNVGAKKTFNIVLSMPPGTDRAAVTLAAREFAHQEFRLNYSYVFATHDDEKHPHVHLCVKAMGKDGVRLNPRKADLQHWRELFAEKLREFGIEANATRRPVRGVTKRPRKQAVVHLEKRGLMSLQREALTQAATAFIRSGNPISNPLSAKILRTRQFVVASWNAIGHALQAQGDSKLSAEVKAFVEALPPAESVGERLEQQLLAQINNQKQRDKGVER
ncbi:relaxase/mobilization nuclease domain-containing protein [Methylovorus glucosotrophus]|uniref:MobA/VirD2-like nuclease domain-containing protein n=1 Tax=Methylovorus glucosotrophus (strain SIP3-4) TaxID=582744 RepID=C6XA75_METGS|nr:relaxase/mobilization nuclease domain-containing protein [Methylovorus glucosotrophus]ACT51616.1 hypothetical protein Msip34_2376 [Methylovorus glucosotrophus SIP3-4]